MYDAPGYKDSAIVQRAPGLYRSAHHCQRQPRRHSGHQVSQGARRSVEQRVLVEEVGAGVSRDTQLGEYSQVGTGVYGAPHQGKYLIDICLGVGDVYGGRATRRAQKSVFHIYAVSIGKISEFFLNLCP